MDIPRFDQNRNGGSDLGDAFQQFAYDLLLSDYPGMHLFPTRGKDGGIDLSETKDGSRLVVECKYIGTDGISQALKRWGEVARNLKTQLAEPEEAARHEAQYGPWYSTAPAITEYVFCVSSVLGNQEQQDELRREIAGFFAELGTRHAHLSHLANISVTVLDWNDLAARLRSRPLVLFHWFKLLREYGLAPLDEVADRSTFRSYLYSDKLPYHSRSQQLDLTPAPPGADIPDEEGLLRLLEGDTQTGLILTGSGGVGKTRLTLEIGYLAQSKGWVVLRVLRRLKEDALDRLAQLVTKETKVLLLIDYVETQRDFDELMSELNDLNDSLGLHLRYVANCRTSYYRSIAAISRHRDINLSPALEDPAVANWFETYQRQTVRHILAHSNIEITDRHLHVCRDTPVLAVFISYLHGRGREPELESLLEEESFAGWIVKRLKLSFPDSRVFPNLDQLLAQLSALFPMPAATAFHPELRDHQESFDRLAADGWVEKLPADDEYKTETWRTAHDVFADQILLFYFDSIPHTIENFVRNLFFLARRVGCLRSALTTLQRLVDKPALRALYWPAILDAAIAEDPHAWGEARNLLVRTSLLTPLQIISLLGEHEEVWRGAEEDPNFQLAIGWLARWSLSQKEIALSQTQRSILESWLQKAAPHVTVNNYVLTSGVKFCPPSVREFALNWILTRPREFQTHYLIVAWLEQKLPKDDIVLAVGQWIAKYSDSLHLSFIVEAWLEAGGSTDLLHNSIQNWLALYKTFIEARFVYKAWLDAGGDTELVRAPLADWLAEHKGRAEAQFVYKAWLDAGGDTELVRDPLTAWLVENKTAEEASFVYQAWLDAGGDEGIIREPLRVWLAEHKALAEASFVYKAWLDAGGDTELIQDSLREWLNAYKALAEASFVYKAWLDAGGDTELVQDSLREWLNAHGTSAKASFVFQAWLESGGSFSVIRTQVIQWLSHNYDKEEAGFLTKILAKQRDIPAETVRNILSWCSKFPASVDALWRLTQLRGHLLEVEVAEDVWAATEAVLNLRLSNDAVLLPVVREQIITLFGSLIAASGFQVGNLRKSVDGRLLRWLRHPASYGDKLKSHSNVQRLSYVYRITNLIYSGALSVVADREPLERFLQWVNNWLPKSKQGLGPLLARMANDYPAPGLWDIVKLDEDAQLGEDREDVN